MEKALDEQLKKVYKLGTSIRGEFIDQAIWIEKIIETIIAEYFCQDTDRQHLFFSLVINSTDFTFGTKSKILKDLLLLRYKVLSKKHSSLFDKLNQIRAFRNKLAHAHLDTSEEFLSKKFDDRIQIIFYDKGRTKQQVITIKDKQKRLGECTQIIRILMNIQKTVKKS